MKLRIITPILISCVSINCTFAQIVTEIKDDIPNDTKRLKGRTEQLTLTYSELDSNTPVVTASELTVNYTSTGSMSGAQDLSGQSFRIIIDGYENFNAAEMEAETDRIAYLARAGNADVNDHKFGIGVDTNGNNSYIADREALTIEFDLSKLSPEMQQGFTFKSLDALNVSSGSPEQISMQLLRNNDVIYSNIEQEYLGNQTISLNLDIEDKDIFLISGEKDSNFRVNHLTFDLASLGHAIAGKRVSIPEPRQTALILIFTAIGGCGLLRRQRPTRH